MPHLMTDDEAREWEREHRPETLWGVPVPDGEWVGPGAEDEFRNGRGDDDDGE